MVQGTLLITLLSIPLIGMSGPQVAIWEIHPVTIVLIAAYLFGLRLVYSSQKTKCGRLVRQRKHLKKQRMNQPRK